MHRRLATALVAGHLAVLTACSATPDANAARAADSTTDSAANGIASSAARKGAPARLPGEPRAGTPMAGDLVAVDSMTVNEPLRLPAQLYVEQDAAIGARSSGVLRSLSVELGSVVQAGQVIGRLEDEVQRLAVSRADVALERASKVLGRVKEMRASNSAPVAEQEDAEYQLRLAEVAKREADLAAERTTIVAPFGGIVSARFVQPGQLLAVNDTVLRLTARGPYLVRARIPESESVRAGARFAVQTLDGRALAARVLRLAPALDAASGTREAILQIDSRGDALLAGSAVLVELPRGARRILAVPRTSVSDDGYVVVSDGSRTVMRPVMTGGVFGDRVEIRAGVVAGERVRRIAR
ncbi:MAG: efflux RND transporter periplasmic adaptor subunit [Gemmatimonadota bacterium]